MLWILKPGVEAERDFLLFYLWRERESREKGGESIRMCENCSEIRDGQQRGTRGSSAPLLGH
jgi:hypothetical protein